MEEQAPTEEKAGERIVPLNVEFYRGEAGVEFRCEFDNDAIADLTPDAQAATLCVMIAALHEQLGWTIQKYEMDQQSVIGMLGQALGTPGLY